ncbi:hypothetical protein B0O80DRAFT_429721 [Mortierella sp. GBAus27b]|nr:hypothetical protein B0O80DRAFT_429721 [Mortierella sp. GBAus27b]
MWLHDAWKLSRKESAWTFSDPKQHVLNRPFAFWDAKDGTNMLSASAEEAETEGIAQLRGGACDQPTPGLRAIDGTLGFWKGSEWVHQAGKSGCAILGSQRGTDSLGNVVGLTREHAGGGGHTAEKERPSHSALGDGNGDRHCEEGAEVMRQDHE